MKVLSLDLLARIAAPFNGTLTVVNSKVGDQITPGTLAFQLDDLTHLYIDAAVAEVDIARVKVGQSVTIVMDALPGKQYAGTVTEISSVGKNTAGTVNFIVTVEIASPSAEIAESSRNLIRTGPADIGTVIHYFGDQLKPPI